MANGFEFQQVDQAYWDNGFKAWVYRFRIVNTEYAADFVLTFGVADSVPEQDRLAEAKNYLRAFVATLSSELKGEASRVFRRQFHLGHATISRVSRAA